VDAEVGAVLTETLDVDVAGDVAGMTETVDVDVADDVVMGEVGVFPFVADLLVVTSATPTASNIYE